MFSAFAKSIAEHSGQSVKQYRRELGPAALEIFLKAAVNITAYMGWGGWTFRPNTPGEMALDVAKSTLPEKRGRSEPPGIRIDARHDGGAGRCHFLGRSDSRGDRMRSGNRRRRRQVYRTHELIPTKVIAESLNLLKAAR